MRSIAMRCRLTSVRQLSATQQLPKEAFACPARTFCYIHTSILSCTPCASCLTLYICSGHDHGRLIMQCVESFGKVIL